MNDVQRYLGEFDLSPEDLEAAADTFLYCTIKLEGVDTRAANLMKSLLETLGGGIAMRRGAKDYTVRETDVLITGSRRTLQLLAARLKGEPYGLDTVGSEITACMTSGIKIISWGNRTLDFTHKTYVMGILNCTAGLVLSEQQVRDDQGCDEIRARDDCRGRRHHGRGR